jgi:hypothetical protein
MIRTLCIFLSLILLNISISKAQSEYLKTKYLRMAEVYGYLKGQNYFLDLTKKKFPDLEISVLRVQSLFKSTFGNCLEKVQNYIIEFYTDAKFVEFDNKIQEEILKLSKYYTKEAAESFIHEVEDRAKGNVPSPVLETLLSFKYSDYPEYEFIDGFVNTFKTKGHPKSNGTDWQIKIPKSWKKAEADRPLIIQKFISDCGDGNQSIMIAVDDLDIPEGQTLTFKEINEIFKEDESEKWISDGTRLISYHKTKLENNIVGVLETEEITERLDVKIKIRIIQYMFIVKNKIYYLQCMVNSTDLSRDLDFDMKKYSTLFKVVANSIVINSQY